MTVLLRFLDISHATKPLNSPWPSGWCQKSTQSGNRGKLTLYYGDCLIVFGSSWVKSRWEFLSILCNGFTVLFIMIFFSGIVLLLPIFDAFYLTNHSCPLSPLAIIQHCPFVIANSAIKAVREVSTNEAILRSLPCLHHNKGTQR